MNSEDRHRKRVIYFLILLIFSYVFFFYNLGSYSLKEPDEGRYAEIPREMVEQGDYVVPHLNYVRYFEKPPLLYWLTAASYRAFGVGELPFRFPNALAALLCVLVTYAFACRRFGEEVGFTSSFILMSSFGFVAMARAVTIDMLFAFLLSAALFCFHEFYVTGKRVFLNLFYAALALAVLAKGPVAVLLMVLTILIFLFVEKRLSFLKKILTPGGLLLFAGIAVPWFILICSKEKEFFQFFFVDQHILRFLTTKHRRSGPLYYFIPVLFIGMLPWSFFIPRAIVRLWRDKEIRLFLIWSIVVFGFFSVSGSKLPPYILPVFPSLAIVLGCLFARDSNLKPHRTFEMAAYLVSFAFLALAALAYGTNNLSGRYLGDMLGPANLRVELRNLSLALSVVSCVLFLAFASGLVSTFRRYFVALCAFSFLVVGSTMFHASVIDRLNSTKSMAQTINEVGSDDKIIVNLNSFNETLPFYVRQRTYLVAHTGELDMGSKYPDAKPFFLDRDRFLLALQSDRPAFVVFKEKRIDQVRSLYGQHLIFFQCEGNRCLAANPQGAEVINQRERSKHRPPKPLTN